MKLKRLVSAVLAVGMALTMLPTAAFAASTSIELDENGYIKDANGVGQKTYAAKGSIDYSGIGRINSSVVVYGEITGGDFDSDVKNYGKITGGNFLDVLNFDIYNNANCGQIQNAVIKKYTSSLVKAGITTPTTVDNSIIYGSMTISKDVVHSITNSIVSDNKNLEGDYQTFTADGCTVRPVGSIGGTSIPDEAVFTGGKVYLTGNVPTREFVVTPNSPAFERWDSDSIAEAKSKGATITENGNKLTVTLPDSGDITIKVVEEPIPLTVGVVNNETVPVYKGNVYEGSSTNGWLYDKDTKTLTILPNGKVNLNSPVDWNIINEGTVEGGTFNYQDEDKSVFQNKEGGQILDGIFNVRMVNNGTIEKGVFNMPITSYGTVNGGTFTNTYSGTKGTTNGGVFPRVSTFEDGVNTTWVALNNCTINGISGMAGIVGKQTVTVKADTGFKCWSVSGDTDFALTEEQKYNPELTLTLNGEDKGNIILTAQTEEGYYRLNLTDGKAYSATADGAKDQEINAAKPGDTVILEADASLIPDGMVFDRWEVTGDTELTGNFDAKAEKTSFTMPKSEVTLRAMYRMADQPEEPNVLGTVAMVATAGVGAAVVGYTGYMIGTELYLNTVLPEGTAIPNNATELAKLLWTDAGKPAPAAVLAADATDEQKALTWAVENQLISADKAADASVGRWEVIDAWNKAQEMKKA